MNDIVEAIVSLFEADGGYSFSHNERVYAQRKYDALPADAKAFLCGLSKEDLENVCIGERRGEADVLYRGLWRPLPPGVDAFLTDIWENMS
jgi:hypothetical protein